MALRADSSDSSEKPAAGGASALAGLPSYWDVAECPPRTEWEKWWDLFVMAVNVKYSISVTELPQTPTEQQPRPASLINNLKEPHEQVPLHNGVNCYTNRNARELQEETFKKPRNRTLDRYKFFARKQKQGESLRGEF